MTKRKFITIISILLLIIALNIAMFGFVFRLKNQQVKYIDSVEGVNKSEIIDVANLKRNSSIFLIDKERAIKNVESKFPDLKVVQIKTTGIQTIQFVVRTRYETYYIETFSSFYILDEEMKVLKIIDKRDNPDYDASKLIKLTSNDIEITASTNVCNFIGTKTQQKLYESVYSSVINVATKEENGQKVYFEREDFLNSIKEIDYEEFNSYDKIVIYTTDGVKLDIENPNKDIEEKINICFATINKFKIEDSNKPAEQQRFKTGTIKIYYDLENKCKTIYTFNT